MHWGMHEEPAFTKTPLVLTEGKSYGWAGMWFGIYPVWYIPGISPVYPNPPLGGGWYIPAAAQAKAAAPFQNLRKCYLTGLFFGCEFEF